MMESISNKGNGVYGVISTGDQAVDYVHDRMLSTMDFIARDVKIQVAFSPDNVHAYRLLGYENRALEDQQFYDDTIDAGEIGAGHTVTALYELVPAGGQIPSVEGAPAPEEGEPYDGELQVAPDHLCLVRIRYKDIDAPDDDPALQIERFLSPDEVADGFAGVDGDFQWAAAIAAFAEILKQSPYGNTAYLATIGQQVEANANNDPDRLEFQQLFDQAEALLSP
jgi:Ca-activated chloride channel family protein